MNILLEYAEKLKEKGKLKRREMELLERGKRVPLSAMQLFWLEKQLTRRGYKLPKNGRMVREEKRGIKLLKNLPDELYEFQKEGVSFLHHRGGKALLAHDMGLGKTIQALAYLELHPELRPAVVICPGAVKYNWEKEIWRWTQDDIEVLEGKQGEELTKTDDMIYVINYEILRNARRKVLVGVDQDGKEKYDRKPIKNTGWIDYLLKIKPKAVVIDECHRISNHQSDQTKDILRLCKKADSIIGLSGTPIKNKVADLYTFVKMIEPRLFASRLDFRKRYCGAMHNGFGWKDTGGTHLEELHKILTDSVMLRRMKTEVLKELPDKRRVIIPVDIPKDHPYWKAEDNFLKWLKSTGASKSKIDSATKAKAIAQLSAVRKLVIQAKLPTCLEWMSDFLHSNEKLVSFCWHKDTVEVLRKKFNKSGLVWLTGDCTAKQRERAVEQFQTDSNVKLFIGNLKAAGEGITLTAASNTVTLELDWTPTSHMQAEDRILRIGQDQACTNYYLVARGTIEEKLVNILNEKMEMITKALDGKDSSGDLLSDFLNLL